MAQKLNFQKKIIRWRFPKNVKTTSQHNNMTTLVIIEISMACDLPFQSISFQELRWKYIYFIFSYCYFCSWFFGKITRKDAERHLKLPQSGLGTFLIRESETEPGEYILLSHMFSTILYSNVFLQILSDIVIFPLG